MATKQMKLIHLNDDSKRRSIALCLSAYARTYELMCFQLQFELIKWELYANTSLNLLNRLHLHWRNKFYHTSDGVRYVGGVSSQQHQQQQRPNLYIPHIQHTYMHKTFFFQLAFFSFVFFACSYCTHYFNVI